MHWHQHQHCSLYLLNSNNFSTLPTNKDRLIFFKILEEICIRQSLTVLLYCQEKRVRLIVKITFSQTPTVRQVHHRGFWIDELLYFSFSAKATWVSSAGKRIE